MKIAIARDGTAVSGHFGHCEAYALYQSDGSGIKFAGDLASPGHEPGKLPPFLASHGVNVIIAGGMGQRAVDLFRQNGINVILGISGPVETAAQDYHSGRMATGGGSICQEHECSGHD